jgi:spore coat protein CotF
MDAMPMQNQQGQQQGQQQSQQQGQQGSLQDRDVMQNLLNESKIMANSINQYTLEATNEELRRDYMTVLGEVFAQQKQVYDMMQQKGYYNPTPAQQQDISQVQSKFQGQGQQGQQGQTQQQMQ